MLSQIIIRIPNTETLHSTIKVLWALLGETRRGPLKGSRGVIFRILLGNPKNLTTLEPMGRPTSLNKGILRALLGGSWSYKTPKMGVS